jgi:hypothetical protein
MLVALMSAFVVLGSSYQQQGCVGPEAAPFERG